MDLILASRSPRRRDILSGLGYVFGIEPSDADEILDDSLPISKAVEKIAHDKAENVFYRHPDAAILGADTVVVLDGNVFGKPESEEAARKMLKSLSGTTHQVYTGVCLIAPGFDKVSHARTNVTFRDLSDQEIDDYVRSGKWMDKAGAYGIQETDFVSRIEGSYTNVVGLPIRTVELLIDCAQTSPLIDL